MPDFLFGPVPHSEAADYIASKAPVSRAVFDELLPELRSRAFVISGVEAADAVQAVRDRIAELPQGARWDDVKKDVAGKITPYLVTSADPDDRDAQLNAANRRAELLVRTHGFQAYSSASYKVMDRQRDVMPYWQYMTMHDNRVRHSHAALNGLVLPANSSFWTDHYPPWDFGCRCQVVPLSPEDRDDIQKADAARPPEAQRVLEGPYLEELEKSNKLVRGPNQIFNVAPPPPDKYSWHPDDRGFTVADLEQRYDAKTFGEFKAWAEKTETGHPATQSVWGWITGAKPKPAAPPPAPATPPAPAATKPASVAELLAHVAAPPDAPATVAHMQRLLDALKRDNPPQSADLIHSISMPLIPLWNINRQKVQQIAQEFFDLLPRGIVANHPKIKVRVLRKLPGKLGTYTKATRVLQLNGGMLNTRPQDLRTTIFHELTHWVHEDSPDGAARMKAFFSRRTAGFTEPMVNLPMYTGAKGYRDDLTDVMGDSYAARVYPFENQSNPGGLEIATKHLEKLALPAAQLLDYWNYKSPQSNAYAWREALTECLHLLYPPVPATPTP